MSVQDLHHKTETAIPRVKKLPLLTYRIEELNAELNGVRSRFSQADYYAVRLSEHTEQGNSKGIPNS